ncbi:hypothetical protein NDU88_006370, partial [Pleurodeles waltl]
HICIIRSLTFHFPDLGQGLCSTMPQRHFFDGQAYSIPLIQPDLRREEAIHQIADALQYLQKVSSDIFT